MPIIRAMKSMRKRLLNIRHGNRVLIVVRGQENCLQGEGEQLNSQYNRKDGARGT